MLKKAGVVDAGGKGLCYIFDGMLSVFKDGVIVSNEQPEAKSDLSSDDFFRQRRGGVRPGNQLHLLHRIHRGPRSRMQEGAFRAARVPGRDRRLRRCGGRRGDHQGHVHTEDPGNALQAGLTFGQLLTVKIENMKEQHRKAQEANEENKAKAEKKTADSC